MAHEPINRSRRCEEPSDFAILCVTRDRGIGPSLWYPEASVRSLLVALLAVCLWLPAAGSRAQSMTDADAAFDRGEIDAARQSYQRALESGALSGDELVRAYLRSGVLAMWTGDDATAERHLRWALSLDATLEAPLELNPGQRRSFRVLRAEVAEAGALDIAIEPGDGRRATVTVSAPSFAGLRVRAEARGGSQPFSEVREAAPSFDVEVPAATWGAALRVEVGVTLIDPHGNTLRTASAQLRRMDAPLPLGTAEPDAPAATTSESSDAGGGDDTGVIVGVTLAILAVLGGAAAAVGYLIWDDQNPSTVRLVPALTFAP